MTLLELAEEEREAAALRAVMDMGGDNRVTVNGVDLCVLDLRAIATRREELALDLRRLADKRGAE